MAEAFMIIQGPPSTVSLNGCEKGYTKSHTQVSVTPLKDSIEARDLAMMGFKKFTFLLSNSNVKELCLE